MALKWNLDGNVPGSFQQPPPEYLDFLKAKRKELILLALTSSAYALIGVNLYVFGHGDNTLDVLASVLGWQALALGTWAGGASVAK